MEFVIIVWLLCGLIGTAAANKGHWNPVVGFIAGFVLGPLAILLFAVDGVASRPTGRPTQKKCGDCAEMVQPDAKVCRYCGHKFDW
jgi:hypothetical protein